MKFDLVFEGGGAKGIVFTGAIQAFEERGHTFGRLMGTSAGAITATLLAAGYTAAESLKVLSEKVDGAPVFTRFMGIPDKFDPETVNESATREWLRATDIPFLPSVAENKLDDWIVENLLHSPLYRHLFSFVELGGWYAADAFLDWMVQRLDSGTFNNAPRQLSGLTLRQFHDKTAVDLTLLASDTTAGRLLVLNHRTAPDCPIIWAVRMSMSVPLLWQEVVWRSQWGPYLGRDITGNAVVDGGLLSNFPIELFITQQPEWTALMGPKQSAHLIGMLIDENLPLPDTPAVDQAAGDGILGKLRTIRRLGDLVNTVTQARDKLVIENYADFVVRLPAKGYKTTDFDMDDNRRDALINGGLAAMNQYLDTTAASPRSTSPPFEAAAFFSAADDIAGRILGGP